MRFADIRKFLSHLTARKVFNALKVISSYYAARLLRKPVQWGQPLTLSVEPTTSCNLRCPECVSGLRAFSRPTGMLDSALLKSVLDQSADTLLYLYLYFQGEPFLHPQFAEMVKAATARNVYTVTSTNGHFMTEATADDLIRSGLSRIIFSVDGATQETYSRYRTGGHLDKVLRNLRLLAERKKMLQSGTPHIIMQCIVMKHNEHELKEMRALAKTCGADELTLKTFQVLDPAKANDMVPDAEEFSRYELRLNGFYRIRNKLLNHCWKLWHSAVITWDGRVVPCCFDKDARHQLGDIRSDAFKKIWRGKAYRNFRTSLLRSRSEIDICTNCSEGTKVWG